MALFPLLLSLAPSFFTPRLELMAEILALRQQLAILNRTAKRPTLRSQDRLFWITLARFWQDWRSVLLIVKPETVIKWHRQGFRHYWRWKSKARRPGRLRIDAEIRDLIRRFSQENPLWGTPRIKTETIFSVGWLDGDIENTGWIGFWRRTGDGKFAGPAETPLEKFS